MGEYCVPNSYSLLELNSSINQINTVAGLKSLIQTGYKTLVPHQMAILGFAEIRSGVIHQILAINVPSKYLSSIPDNNSQNCEVLSCPIVKEWAKTRDTTLINGVNSLSAANKCLAALNRYGVRNMVVGGIPDISGTLASVFCFGGVPEDQSNLCLELIDLTIASLHKALAKICGEGKSMQHHVPNDHNLTEREIQTVSYLSQGLSDSGIAARMQISVSTVRCHLRNIAAKLNASNRVQILTKAISQGVIKI